MCYSTESSAISFGLGFPASIYLLMQKNKFTKHIGLFFSAVVLMQLAEFFMWIDQDCGIINNLATKSVTFILMLQTYFLILGGYIFKTIPIPKNIYKILLVIVTIYTILISIRPFLTNKKYCSKPNKSNSLQWNGFNEFMNYFNARDYYFWIFKLSAIILSLQSNEWLYTSIIGVVFFYLNENKNIMTQYTRWCYYSAGIPMILSFLNVLN